MDEGIFKTSYQTSLKDKIGGSQVKLSFEISKREQEAVITKLLLIKNELLI